MNSDSQDQSSSEKRQRWDDLRAQIRARVIPQVIRIVTEGAPSRKTNKHRLEALALLVQVRGALDPVSRDHARVLIAAAQHGANVDKIAKMTGLERGLIEKVEARMRAAGRWVGTTVAFEHWLGNGSFSLFLDDLTLARGLSCSQLSLPTDSCDPARPNADNGA